MIFTIALKYKVDSIEEQVGMCFLSNIAILDDLSACYNLCTKMKLLVDGQLEGYVSRAVQKCVALLFISI